MALSKPHGLLLALALLVTGCGGGGGGDNVAPATPIATVAPQAPAPPPANVATLVVDDGPAALATGTKPYTSDNAAFVTVVVCIPATTTCQTIDHVLVDTGSVGLRLVAGVLSDSVLAGLPMQRDSAAKPVGECYGFVDGYAFGSVRYADFQIGGEKVSGLALQVLGDGGRFASVPAQCSAGGGGNIGTVQKLGANGILGVGVTATDCGASCVAGGTAAAIYYDCPATGCGEIIARAATTIAPFEQLPNPVAAMAVDNNGTVISLPAVPAEGARTLTGTLVFGIGTQGNNALGTATVLATSTSAANTGPGLLTVVYRAQSLPNSFVDSGSNAYFFVDATIAACTDTNLAGYYCPATPVTLMPVIQGRNGASVTVAVALGDAKQLLTSVNTALPGIGADPGSNAKYNAYPRSFDFGLPFFFGRNVYTAIEGRPSGSSVGPFVAF